MLDRRPDVIGVDAEGAVRLTDAEVAAVADTVVAERGAAERENLDREA